jgi:ABC-type sugar transport system permease subunit
MAAETHREERSNAAAWWQALTGLRQEAWGEALAGYLFIGPAVILFFVFNAYPVIRGLLIAFSDYRYLIPNYQPFNGVDNWIEMAGDKQFWGSLGRSFEYTAIYFLLNFVLAFLAAVLISQVQRPREAGLYRVIAYLPVILPIAVAVLVWKQLLSPEFGYVAYALKGLLGATAPDFLGNPMWTVPVLAIVSAWKTMGTNVLLLLVGLYNINQELYEAAAIDGAGWWRRLFHITIPLLRPTFTIVFVLAAGVLGATEESLIFFGLTDAGPEGAGRLVGRYAYEVAFRLGDLRWGYAAAMNLTVGLMSMAISAVIFRALRSGRI